MQLKSVCVYCNSASAKDTAVEQEIRTFGREISTDPAILRKGEKAGGGFDPLNLLNFDAVVLASSTGEMPLDDQQKRDLLAFVHDDGKGLVGIHAALDANYQWPAYAEMLGVKDYLRKPFAMEKLLRSIYKVLGTPPADED